MLDREVAARLAGLRRVGVDLDRRLRGDNRSAARLRDLLADSDWASLAFRELAETRARLDAIIERLAAEA